MNTLIQARIDSNSKQQAESIFAKMGITLNEGIRMFIQQTIHDKGLPFRPVVGDIPTEETKEAMAELKSGKNLKRFKTVNALMEDLLSEED